MEQLTADDASVNVGDGDSTTDGRADAVSERTPPLRLLHLTRPTRDVGCGMSRLADYFVVVGYDFEKENKGYDFDKESMSTHRRRRAYIPFL